MGVLYLIYTLLYIPYAYIEAVYRLIMPNRPKSIQGQIALVTGGGKGIGRETALQLAVKGATVILWDVDEESIASTLKELHADRKAAYAYTCDVGNADQVRKMAAQLRRDVGDVDILVNNAGVCWFKRILDLTVMEIKKTMDVNLLAQYWTIKEFLPMMVKQNRGHIVNVASIDAFLACDYLADYGASKYGMRGLSENLEQELKNQRLDGIKVTTVYPGLTNTSLVKVTPFNPATLKMIEPSQVAAAIVEGIELDLWEVFIPRIGRALSFLQRALPRKAYLVVMNYFWTWS